MGSTNIPSNETSKKVRIQCKTPDDRQLEFEIETSQFQKLLSTLIDCKYKTTGCLVNDYMKDIKEHEERCLYRTIRCPVQSKEDLCEDILAMNLFEHAIGHKNLDSISTEENFFSLPIDLGEGIELSKMVTIHDDIILCRVKTEDRKLRASLLFIRNTNAFVNCEINLIADDVVWNKQKIEMSNSDSGFNEQSAVFDVEKLIQVRNIFNSITIRVECNFVSQESIAKSKEFLQKIVCAFCGDFLTSVYYESKEKTECSHVHCQSCYVSKESWFIRKEFNLHGVCLDTEACNCQQARGGLSTQYLLAAMIDSLKEYKYPCRNESLGCKQVIPQYTSKHELLCHYNVFGCALCEFTAKYFEFISHLQEKHSDKMINMNVYNVTDINQELCYMFAFGSIFLCKIINHKTCTIQWISSSVLKHNFSFEVTFLYNYGKRLTLRTHTDPRKVNCETDCYKSIYNIIKKTASFKVYTEEKSYVKEISFTVLKI